MKRFLFALLMFSHVTRLIALLNRRRVTILCYHSVTAHEPPILDDRHKLHIPVSIFVKQLEYLRRFHNVISLDDFLDAMREQRELPGNSVILTFEDGVRNFLTVAAPHLQHLGMPATNFIITGHTSLAVQPSANHKWQPADDRTFLSWPDIDELAQAGIQFGSHTCSHASLPDLSAAEAEKELTESHETLRARIPQDHFPLSYPFGQVSDEIRRLAADAGYSCGITTLAGVNDRRSDLFALRRTVIAGDDDLPTFAARVSGLTTRFNNLRRRPIREIGSAFKSITNRFERNPEPNRSASRLVCDSDKSSPEQSQTFDSPLR
jgi:peptidoglycan/xylan/chitin deacetylase (PgdA/CDA1 family)